MFNISETKTKIHGLPEGVTFGQLQYSLYHVERHTKPKYDYYGKYVTRGTMNVLVSKGLLKIYFYEKSGWAIEIDVLEFIPSHNDNDWANMMEQCHTSSLAKRRENT